MELRKAPWKKHKRFFGTKEDCMRRVHNDITRCAQDGLNVLLTGPSGSGKGVLASYYAKEHYQQYEENYQAPSRGGLFLALNCACFMGEIGLVELFGKDRDAFPPPVLVKGAFERIDEAGGGILFLDEIGDCPMHVQAQLLTTLENNTYSRVGSAEVLEIENPIHIISATNKPVDGTDSPLRGDLLHRLRPGDVKVPGMDERPDDLSSALGDFFTEALEDRRDLAKLSSKPDWLGSPKLIEDLKKTVRSLVQGQSWRDLKNVSQFAVCVAGTGSRSEFIDDVKTRFEERASMLPARSTEDDHEVAAVEDTLKHAFGATGRTVKRANFQALARFFARKKTNEFSTNEIEKQLGVSDRAVNYWIKDLISQGPVVKEDGGRYRWTGMLSALSGGLEPPGDVDLDASPSPHAKDLEELQIFLKQYGRVYVRGLPRSGKTPLVLALTRQLEAAGHRVLWWTLLGSGGTQALLERLKQHAPDDPERTLLVLDDAQRWRTDDLDPLITILQMWPVKLVLIGDKLPLDLAVRKVKEYSLVERAAAAVHHVYSKSATGSVAGTAWDDLPEEYRESCRQQVPHMLAQLERIGYVRQPLEGGPEPLGLSPDEVEKLAEAEHDRWMDERKDDGWRLGYPKQGPPGKVSPYLVPYGNLPEGIKQYDRDFVTGFHEVLGAQDLALRRPGETPRPPLAERVLRIGVTGRRDLSGDDLDAVVLEVIERAREQRGLDAGARVVVTSPLAEGADQLVARLVLDELGGELRVPLPLEQKSYLAGFDSDDGRQAFKTLCKRATQVVKLPPVVKEGASPDEHRCLAYEQAGRFVIDDADLLIAIWDGEPERGVGGAGQIVRMAREGNTEVVWISTKTRRVEELS